MATHCLIPLLGKMLRVTELDSCGAPLTDGEYVATDGFVSITLSSEVEDGAEIIVRKASGALCVNEKQADSFKRFTVELHLCGVNPSLMAIMSNAEPYYDGDPETGDIIGFTVPEGEIKKWFSLELWTGLSGQACEPGTEEASGYILLPFVTAGILGDIEITGEDAIDFSITGAATKGGNAWGVGPYDVVLDETSAAAPLPVPIDPFDHLLMIDTALAPPPSACEPQPIPTGALLLSSVTPVAQDFDEETVNPVLTVQGQNLVQGAYLLNDGNGHDYATDTSVVGPGGDQAELRVSAADGMYPGTYDLTDPSDSTTLPGALVVAEVAPPTDADTIPTIDTFARRRGIDLGTATTKAEKLAAIAAALPAPVPA